MSLDERLAALREDDDTMNNTPPMSRRSSFLGSLSRRSRTSSIASDPGLSRRSSESIAPTLTRQRSATESELLPGRRHLIEVKHEWVPSEKWLPSIGVSVADRRLAIAFEHSAAARDATLNAEETASSSTAGDGSLPTFFSNSELERIFLTSKLFLIVFLTFRKLSSEIFKKRI